jgi:hypothetical protein
MLKHLLSVLAVWTLIVGCCFALSATSVPTSQADVTTQAVRTLPDTAAAPPEIRSDRRVEQEMMAFERHARVDMILYKGHFGQAEWAEMHLRTHLNAVALAVKGPGK